MDREVKQRLTWVQHYEQSGDAGSTCRRCGIFRPTPRKWWRRYQAEGVKGLESRSRRPKHIPFRKVTPEVEQWILELRRKRKIGSRRIQHELERLHDFHLSLETIHKVLKRNQVTPLRRPPRRKHPRRYEKKIPGERVQMVTMKVAPGLFQYTSTPRQAPFNGRWWGQFKLIYLSPLALVRVGALTGLCTRAQSRPRNT